jgi:hypothetical protein
MVSAHNVGFVGFLSSKEIKKFKKIEFTYPESHLSGLSEQPDKMDQKTRQIPTSDLDRRSFHKDQIDKLSNDSEFLFYEKNTNSHIGGGEGDIKPDKPDKCNDSAGFLAIRASNSDATEIVIADEESAAARDEYIARLDRERNEADRIAGRGYDYAQSQTPGCVVQVNRYVSVVVEHRILNSASAKSALNQLG